MIVEINKNIESFIMVDGYILKKVLNTRLKKLGIKKLFDTKILIKTDDKFPDGITLKNVLTFITHITKYGDRFNPQMI